MQLAGPHLLLSDQTQKKTQVPFPGHVHNVLKVAPAGQGTIQGTHSAQALWAWGSKSRKQPAPQLGDPAPARCPPVKCPVTEGPESLPQTFFQVMLNFKTFEMLMKLRDKREEAEFTTENPECMITLAGKQVEGLSPTHRRT